MPHRRKLQYYRRFGCTDYTRSRAASGIIPGQFKAASFRGYVGQNIGRVRQLGRWNGSRVFALCWALLLALSCPAHSQAVAPPDSSADGNVLAADETEGVARLLALLNRYYSDLRESQRTTSGAQELAQREAAREDALRLAEIPFSADKLRLNGAEGLTALARISARLMDPNTPDTRRDIAPICAIKTRQSGALIASENRSLKPLGKDQYIARVQLQTGDTSLRVQSHEWELHLPSGTAAADYIVTLSLAKSAEPEMHIFLVKDLLDQDNTQLPSWLPSELNLPIQAQ